LNNRAHDAAATLPAQQVILSARLRRAIANCMKELMARIKGVTESDASSDEVRQIIAEQKKRHGFISNAAQVSAVRPTIQRGVQALAQGIQESGLIAQELRNLVCVRTAHINGCPY
jgi:hypothetical protein